jgi:hypothetical protein
MSYHSRLNWWQPVEAANASASRAASGVMMNMGNATWKLAADWSRSAMDFNPFKSSLGYQIDKVSGVLGKAITGQPVLFAIIITFLLALVLWRAMKRPGTRPWGKLVQAAVVFGLITMMGTQAAASTGAATPPAEYNPSAGSPVWVANGVTGTIDMMASTAVAAVMDGMLPLLTNATGATASNPWSCSKLIDSGFDVAELQNPTAGAEAVSRAMNAMWISTAYSTYATVQFGDSNPYAKEVACRQLERTTNAGPYTRARMLGQSLYDNHAAVSSQDPSANTPFASTTAPMLAATTDNEVNDAAMVAWAACAPQGQNGASFTVRSGWSDWITPQDCISAFRAVDAEDLKGIGAFNVADIDAAREKTDSPSVHNFISTLHGRDMGVALGSTTSSIIFLIGAFIAAGVFALMSLAVFASKIFMLILVAGMFIILVISLFKNDAVMETMQPLLNRFLGVTIFAFGSTLLLAILATFALIFSSLATLFGAAGTIGAMLWVSMSPLLAVIAVHFLFTKVLKMPSPVSAKGALAWGTAGGAVGGAVGAGLVNRMQNRAASGARAAGRGLLASNKYTGWMVNGRGQGGDRKGAGDAGSRTGSRALSSDQHSEALRGEGLPTGGGAPAAGIGVGAGAAAAGGLLGGALASGARPVVTAERAEAAAAHAAAATKYLSEDKRKQLTREAKKQWREENPGMLTRSIGDLKGKLEERQNARAALLSDELSGQGSSAGESPLLSAAALGKVALINRPSLDEFMLAPGDAVAPMVSALPPAKWKDLSPAGKAEAQKLATAKAREIREARRAERLANPGGVPTLGGAGAGLPAKRSVGDLADRTRQALKQTTKTIGDSSNAAWTEARTKALEFRAMPAATAAATAAAAAESTRRAAYATVDAARKSGYTAAAGASKARQVTQDAVAATRTGRGRAIATGAAAVAGAGLVATGAPVVGAVVVGVAAKKGISQAKERRAQSALTKEAQLNEIIAARAVARKVQVPGTSTVSEAAPIVPRKSH